MLLPGWLNLDSLSIIRLAALILSLVIAGYLFLVARRTLATLFLAGVLCGAFLFNTASFFEFAGPWYWQPRTLKNVLVLLFEDIGLSLAMVFLLFFVYHFPRFRRVERTEFRIVIAASIALNAGVLGLNVYDHFILQWRFSDTRLWDVYWTALYASLTVQFAGAILLLFRKAARLSGHGARSFFARILRPHGDDARSARTLAVILLLPILSVAASLAMTYSIIPFALATYLTWVGLLLFYLLFVVMYLNHSADPMTLQMKLIGVTLVLILSTMGLVALFVGETSAHDYPGFALLPERATIRLTPNQSGSYDIRNAPDDFDEDLGPKLDIPYGRAPRTVALGFEFPFFTSRYRTVQILHGPMIYLGESAPENGWGGYNPQPAIAPLIMNLDSSRGGGVHVRSSPGSVTITWFRLPELGAQNENTIQLVLQADGTIEMRFHEVSPAYGPSVEQLYNYSAASTTGGDPSPSGKPAPFPPRLTGIHPGGHSAPLEPISFTRGLPWSGTRPAVIFESHEAGFARYLSGRIAVLALLTVAASILVLFLIPLLLRTSLFIPLRELSRGIQQVESGDLDVAVRVQSRDEIGAVTRSFNRMVEAIRRVESSFHTLAEDAQDGIIVFCDDTAVYANPRAADMTGHAVPELTRTVFDALFLSAALPPYGVQPDAPAEASLKTATGSLLPVELVYSRILWHGRPAIAVLMRDITRRKREEERAQLEQLKFMRTDKLTSLGVLAAGLAHEINTPNQVILANATVLADASPQLGALLEEGAKGTDGYLFAHMTAAEFCDALPKMLPAIVQSSVLIDGIIRTLRDFAADSPGRGAALFDINEAVRSSVDLLRAYIKRSTDHFTVELQSGLPRVRGNAQRLEQVFINLILNACLSLADRDKAVTVKSCPGGAPATVRVVVSDEGCGIAPDILPHVREAFFTTREASGGTGLGLYVCDAIVSAHGGALELVSPPGSGTRAIVTLPAEVKE